MPTFGTIRGPENWSYTFTEDDYLWACRSLEGEAGAHSCGVEGEAILWTMLNYLYFVRNRTVGRGVASTRPPHTYASILRAYSQPINPYWADKGTPEQQANRRRITNMSLADIRPCIRELVLQFMQGKIDGTRYVGLVHFDNGTIDSGGDNRMKVDLGLEPRRNVFYKLPATASWGKILLPAATELWKPTGWRLWVTVASCIVAAGVAVYYWKKR